MNVCFVSDLSFQGHVEKAVCEQMCCAGKLAGDTNPLCEIHMLVREMAHGYEF